MKDKVKELTKDTAIYGLSTILSRFLNFLLVPFYTHVLATTGAYGIVSTTYAYIAFLNVVYLYGMDAAYLKYASLRKEDDRKDIFSTPFIAVLFSSIIISVLILLFRGGVTYFMEIPSELPEITVYLTFILFFDALSIIPFAYLRLIRKAKKFALIKMLNIIINVLLNVILIVGFKMGIVAVFISNLAASVITFLLLLPDITKNLNFKLDKGILKTMLRFGLPYLPAGLASMVVQVIDRPILQALTNQDVVGVYNANYKMGIFMMLFVSMFQYAWQPFFLNNAKEENAKEIFAKVLTFFVLAGSVILIVISLFIDDAVKFRIAHLTLIRRDYWGGIPIIPVVLLGYLFNGIYVNFTAGIFIEEKTRYLPWVTGAGALTNVIVNYSLIPVWGMMGAAFATLASYFIMAGALFFVTQKFYRIPYEYGKLSKITLSVIITGILFYSIDLHSIFYKLGLLLLFLFLLIVLRVVDKQEIISVAKLLVKRRRIA